MVAHIVEKVVTGLLQRHGDIDGAVGAAVHGIRQTGGGKIRGIFHVFTLGIDDGGGADIAVVDTGDGHDHLIGRAGRVSRHQRAVEHGRALGILQLVKILEIGT